MSQIPAVPHIASLLLCLMALLSPAIAHADDLYSYTDIQGRVYFVDSIEKIPPEYRTSQQSLTNLPTISRVSAPKRRLTKSTSKKPSTKTPTQNATLELFVADWCGYCKALESDLRNAGITYRRYNVETSTTGKRLWKKLGGGVPISRVNGTHIIRGYNPEAILRAVANPSLR